jgi:type II secretory pathway component PulF
VIGFITRWRIRRAFHLQREEVYELLADEVTRDTAKRTATISAVFASWEERDRGRGLPIAIAHASIVRKMNEGGSSFADAIAPLIPFEERMLIWAGEKNGKLEEALRNTVRIKNLLAGMKDAVRAAVLQPAMQFLGVLMTSYMMGTMLWPDMLRDIKPDLWPSWALPSIYWDLWVGRNWPFLGIVLILLAAFHYSLPRWTGRSRQWFDKIPPWSTYRNENANILMTTLAGFLTNGFVITDALEQIRDRSTPYLRWHLNRMIPKIEGKGADAIAAFNTGLLTQAILDRLEDASKTRDLDKTIIHVGDKALESLIKIVKLRAHVVSTTGALLISLMFVYAAAVQMIGTQQATEAYKAVLTGHKRNTH